MAVPVDSEDRWQPSAGLLTSLLGTLTWLVLSNSLEQKMQMVAGRLPCTLVTPSK